jgi:hypothetical protein
MQEVIGSNPIFSTFTIDSKEAFAVAEKFLGKAILVIPLVYLHKILSKRSISSTSIHLRTSKMNRDTYRNGLRSCVSKKHPRTACQIELNHLGSTQKRINFAEDDLLP